MHQLTGHDAAFLYAEAANQPMHVGGLGVFDAEPLRCGEGGIDIARIRRAVEGVLHWIPRYRQKLAWTPVEGWPVWIDDRHFDLGYHIRHIALPRPGRIAELKELAARIHARPLDRRHALWEMWVIEGVEGYAQFAVLNKIHHCMIDGASGADLSQILMSITPEVEELEPVIGPAFGVGETGVVAEADVGRRLAQPRPLGLQHLEHEPALGAPVAPGRGDGTEVATGPPEPGLAVGQARALDLERVHVEDRFDQRDVEELPLPGAGLVEQGGGVS